MQFTFLKCSDSLGSFGQVAEIVIVWLHELPDHGYCEHNNKPDGGPNRNGVIAHRMSLSPDDHNGKVPWQVVSRLPGFRLHTHPLPRSQSPQCLFMPSGHLRQVVLPECPYPCRPWLRNLLAVAVFLTSFSRCSRQRSQPDHLVLRNVGPKRGAVRSQTGNGVWGAVGGSHEHPRNHQRKRAQSSSSSRRTAFLCCFA